MLLLMNNARLGVGFECLGLQETALRLATAYAAERKSMGKTIDKHEMIADYLDEMRTANVERFHQADVSFHLALVRLSNNAVLIESFERSRDLFFKLPSYWRVFNQPPRRARGSAPGATRTARPAYGSRSHNYYSTAQGSGASMVNLRRLPRHL